MLYIAHTIESASLTFSRGMELKDTPSEKFTSNFGPMAGNSGDSGTCHVMALPYPAQSHLNAMMNLCKLMATKSPKMIITVVVTEEYLDLVSPAPELPNIRLRSVPDFWPRGVNPATDFFGYTSAVNSKMPGPCEQLLDQLETPATAIIADSQHRWAFDVAERRNIPSVALWPMSPSVFTVMYHFHLLVENRHFPADLSERGEEIVDYIPGLPPTRLADFPAIFSKDVELELDESLKCFACLRSAKSVIFASFYELEPHVTSTLKATLPFPIYFVGPLIPHAALADTNTLKCLDKTTQPDYFNWLDSQPERSVLYISMGSFLSVSREQMDEMIAGVRASGVHFLWVGRNHAQKVQEACGEMGLVVPWCDQLKVLCHGSIGGFWTHCGWNSTIEGLFAGVPMLTLPIIYDQVMDRKLIVDDWKVGMKVVGAKEVVTRDEIASILRKFMGLEGAEERTEMWKRASELKQKCRSALAKDGSCDTDTNDFIRDILNCQLMF